MQASNGDGTGILKIGRKGRLKIEIGDDLAIEVDCIAVHNNYLEEVFNQHADLNEQTGLMEVGVAKLTACNQATWDFVRNLIKAAGKIGNLADEMHRAEAVANSLTLAEALEIVAGLTKESERLLPFFGSKSPKEPNLPARTELTFSQ